MDYELADVLNDHLPNLNITYQQNKVLSNIMFCRTENMGGHKLKCSNPECDHSETLFNSCRDRHCPKCQGSNQIKWKNKRLNEILPVMYTLLTFTIPRALYGIFEYNQKVCYNILYDAIKETLSNSKYRIGYQLIIHTWTQLLHYHPHIHCFIPNVKVQRDRSNKISTKQLKIDSDKLNIRFKRILERKIMNKYRKGELIHPLLSEAFIKLKLRNTKKYVHMSKNTDPEIMINYLGNYTSKIAISNQRITGYNGKCVTFTYSDRTDGNKLKEIELDAELFLKRFMLHILPTRLTKIRYYGFMANNSKSILNKIREYLLISKNEVSDKKSRITEYIALLIKELSSPVKCTCCNKGIMEIKYSFSPG